MADSGKFLGTMLYYLQYGLLYTYFRSCVSSGRHGLSSLKIFEWGLMQVGSYLPGKQTALA